MDERRPGRYNFVFPNGKAGESVAFDRPAQSFPREARTSSRAARPATVRPAAGRAHRKTAARFPDVFTELPEQVSRRCSKTNKPASSS